MCNAEDDSQMIDHNHAKMDKLMETDPGEDRLMMVEELLERCSDGWIDDLMDRIDLHYGGNK